MNLNSFKGTLYDFLGYFAPGLVGMLFGVAIILKIDNVSDFYCTLKKIGKNISGFEIFIFIIIAYILGHAVASMSSWLIEKNLIEKVKWLKKSLDSKTILGDEQYDVLCTKYRIVFNAQYNDNHIRKIICYVQSKQCLVYETALIFLSFYGMARNFSFIFGVLLLANAYFCILKCVSLYTLIFFAVLFAIFLYEYVRFRKYFLDTILSSFLIPEKTIKEEK